MTVIDYNDNLPTGAHWSWDTEKLGKPIITVDFDHTITTKCMYCKENPGLGHLQDGAKEVLDELHKKYRIFIFTGREPEDFNDIRGFLNTNNIPYDKIITGKPCACFMIDDRAVHHKSWNDTLKEIKKREV